MAYRTEARLEIKLKSSIFHFGFESMGQQQQVHPGTRLFAGVNEVGFRLRFAPLHEAQKLAKWNNLTPFIFPGSRIETERMKPLPAQS
jgi:hypothetical protein